MTNMKRITISVPDEMEEAIYGLRKWDNYNRCSKSEVIRKLVEIGLKAESKKQKKSTTSEQAG